MTMSNYPKNQKFVYEPKLGSKVISKSQSNVNQFFRSKTKVPRNPSLSQDSLVLKSKDAQRSKRSSGQSQCSSCKNSEIGNQPEEVPVALPCNIRLALRKGSRLEQFRDRVKLPDQALPENSFPRWEHWSLDRKIPLLPHVSDTMILSRGKLGQPLHQAKSEYSIRALPEIDDARTCYNSLHDPHARSYLMKPNVRRLLLHQGLISEDGKVLCSLKEFNEYRAYLKTIVDQQLNEYLREDDAKLLADARMYRQLTSHTLRNSGINARKIERRQRAIEYQKAVRTLQMSRYMCKQEKRNAATNNALEQRLHRRLDALVATTARNERHREAVRRMQQESANRAKMINAYITLKEELAKERQEAERLEKQATRTLQSAAWIKKKIDEEEQVVRQERHANEGYSAAIVRKAQKRLEKAFRTSKTEKKVDHIMINHRLSDIRNLQLAYKYFKIWREKVRERAMQNFQSLRSAFDVGYQLRKTVKKLREVSGQCSLSSLIVKFMQSQMIQTVPVKPELNALEKEELEDSKMQDSLFYVSKRYSLRSNESEKHRRESSLDSNSNSKRSQLHDLKLIGANHVFTSKYKVKHRSRYLLSHGVRRYISRYKKLSLNYTFNRQYSSL